jgi:CBS domain-containing protein
MGGLVILKGNPQVLISDILREKGRRVVKARPTDNVQAVVEKLAEHRIGAVVVEDAWMKLVGIFSERDFVNATAKHGAAALGMTIEHLMSSPVIGCGTTDRVEAAMAVMTMNKIRHLPVVADGEVLGIVSIGDLVKHRLDEKELEAHVLLDLSRRHA